MNVSSTSAVAPQAIARQPEALEKGPDHDGDVDDAGKSAAVKATPAPGTGVRVDTSV